MMCSNYTNISLLFIFLSFFLCCKKSYQKKITEKTDNEIVDFFVYTNKAIVEHEERKIDSLLEQINIPFLKDSTGIRVFIYESSISETVDLLIRNKTPTFSLR